MHLVFRSSSLMIQNRFRASLRALEATGMLKREQLHDYQKYCIQFIEDHPESIMILQMGLGKSVCALTACLDMTFDSFQVHKTLVIAPLRVARDVWPAECKETWEH